VKFFNTFFIKEKLYIRYNFNNILNINNIIILLPKFGDWGLGIGDWGLGIGDWAQSPFPNPQSPIPNPHLHFSFISII